MNPRKPLRSWKPQEAKKAAMLMALGHPMEIRTLRFAQPRDHWRQILDTTTDGFKVTDLLLGRIPKYCLERVEIRVKLY